MISTFHADDALTIIKAMRNFGVETYMLAGMTALASQRLVQILCTSCRIAQPANPEVLRHLDRLGRTSDGLIVYERGPGCTHCNSRGIVRRVAVFEFVELDLAMRDAIEAGQDRVLAKLAREAGYVTMLEEALIRILAGEIDQRTLDRFPDVDAHAYPIGFPNTNGRYLDRLKAAHDVAMRGRTSSSTDTASLEALAS
jgi:type II secretory ATPase GspE/PulE/Tfp pilus assembly ATPase PilB-like protein